MIRTIDKVNGVLIQKVTHNQTGGLLRYQTIPDGMVGREQARPFPTLWAARVYATDVHHKEEAA